jgi:hypothetical protein
LHGLLAVWLAVITPLLCVPGLTSDHDHGPHTIFAVPETSRDRPDHQPSHFHGEPAHAHDRIPSGAVLPRTVPLGPVPPSRVALTEPWSTSTMLTHVGDANAALPTAAPVARLGGDRGGMNGSVLKHPSVALLPPWHPPQPV